jgi:hypothetical protein
MGNENRSPARLSRRAVPAAGEEDEVSHKHTICADDREKI